MVPEATKLSVAKFRKCFSAFILFLAFTGSVCCEAHAQYLELIPLHLFKDRKSTPITCGKIVSLQRDAIKVRDGNSQIFLIPVKDLSYQDQRFIKSIKDGLKIYERRRADAEKAIVRLNSGSLSVKKKSLERISSLNYSAMSISNSIAQFTDNEEDIDTQYDGLLTYIKICPANAQSLEITFSMVRKHKQLFSKIQKSPDEFIVGLGKFGLEAEKILIQIAYSCSLQLLDLKQDAQKNSLENPRDLTTTRSSKNKIRAAASKALLQIKADSANKAIIKIVNSAAKPINGRVDTFTIKAILAGLSDNARAPSTFSTVISKFELKFPVEYRNWINRWNAYLPEYQTQQKLKISSKMRNFFDKNKKFLVRGNVLTFDKQLVVLIDANNQRYAFEIIHLSSADQKWILRSENDGKN